MLTKTAIFSSTERRLSKELTELTIAYPTNVKISENSVEIN